MTAILILIAILVGFLVIRLMTDRKKDTDDLQDRSVVEKFGVLVSRINDVAYNGAGSATPVDHCSFNLYHQGSNQILNFHYSTGLLTITWRYKYLRKKLVHRHQFNDVRDLSSMKQAEIADQMIHEMEEAIKRHRMYETAGGTWG